MGDTEEKIEPIFKWGGGKRQLMDAILPLIPQYTRYYEPFLGGAAVLFGLKPKYAVINDCNVELINTYRVIRDNPEVLIRLLEEHKMYHTDKHFYEIRDLDRNAALFQLLSDEERAARTLYLNRTCFNGLYRVNKQGHFNTPCGRYRNPEIVNANRIRVIHKYLSSNNIDIRCGDYKDALKNIRKGAFVYFDPPYMSPEHEGETFTKYTVDNFKEINQVELKEVCDMLNKRGVQFMLSNSKCSFICDLYQEYNISTVKARRCISADGGKRSRIDEVLITNY